MFMHEVLNAINGLVATSGGYTEEPYDPSNEADAEMLVEDLIAIFGDGNVDLYRRAIKLAAASNLQEA